MKGRGSISKLKIGIRALLKNRTDLTAYVEKEYLDTDGTAVIDVRIGSLHEVISPYCTERQRTLNPEFAGFIDHKAYPVPLRYPLRINFIGALTPAEKERLRQAFCEHYMLLLTDRKIDIRHLMYRIIALTALGITLLSSSFAMQAAGVMFTEILSILGSFALWEAADSLILERHELKIAYLSAGQIAVAEVDFSETAE